MRGGVGLSVRGGDERGGEGGREEREGRRRMSGEWEGRRGRKGEGKREGISVGGEWREGGEK